MVRRVFDRLLKESVDRPWYKPVRDFFGRFVKEVGLFGLSIELGLGEAELQSLVRDFVPTLRQLVQRLKQERQALLMILDDINGLAASAEFANWLKGTVDEIATGSHSFPVCVLVAGLEERRQRLVSLQPSLARVFDLVHIVPWTDDESREFYKATFRRASATVTPEALDVMVRSWYGSRVGYPSSLTRSAMPFGVLRSVPKSPKKTPAVEYCSLRRSSATSSWNPSSFKRFAVGDIDPSCASSPRRRSVLHSAARRSPASSGPKTAEYSTTSSRA
jgi:hypothetical protein